MRKLLLFSCVLASINVAMAGERSTLDQPDPPGTRPPSDISSHEIQWTRDFGPSYLNLSPVFAAVELPDRDGDLKPELVVSDFVEANPDFSLGGSIRIFPSSGGSSTLIASPQSPAHGFGGMFPVRDVTGDGISDLIIPELAALNPDGVACGAFHLYSGATMQWSRSIFSPSPVDLGYFGGAMRVADVDHDGMRDLAVTASGESIGSTKGKVYIYSGKDLSLLAVPALPSGNPRSTTRTLTWLNDADGDRGCVIVQTQTEGTPQGTRHSLYVASAMTGKVVYTVTSPGQNYEAFSGIMIDDMDSDGVKDLAIAYIAPDGPEAPAILQVVSGKSGARLHEVTLPAGSGNYGTTLFYGDYINDGRKELAVYPYLTFYDMDTLEPISSVNFGDLFVTSAFDIQSETPGAKDRLGLSIAEGLSTLPIVKAVIIDRFLGHGVVVPVSGNAVFLRNPSTSPAPFVFALKNSSGFDLRVSINGFRLTGEGAGAFVVTGRDNYLLQGGRSETYKVSFNPPRPGRYRANLTIKTDAEPVTVELLGEYSDKEAPAIGQVYLAGLGAPPERVSFSSSVSGSVGQLPQGATGIVGTVDALYTSGTNGVLHRIDLSGGTTSLPGPSPALGFHHLARDAGGKFYAVSGTELLNELVRIDPGTGDTEVISRCNDPLIGEGAPFGGAVLNQINDVNCILPDGNGILLSTWAVGLLRVDPGTGNRTVVSSSHFLYPRGEGPSMRGCRDAVVSPDGSIIVSTRPTDSMILLRVDPESGNRTQVLTDLSASDGTGMFPLRYPVGLTYGPDGILYTVDAKSKGIFQLDPEQGTTRLVGIHTTEFGHVWWTALPTPLHLAFPTGLTGEQGWQFR